MIICSLDIRRTRVDASRANTEFLDTCRRGLKLKTGVDVGHGADLIMIFSQFRPFLKSKSLYSADDKTLSEENKFCGYKYVWKGPLKGCFCSYVPEQRLCKTKDRKQNNSK